MTEERQAFETRLNALMTVKRAAKGVNDAEFVRCSGEIIATLDGIARLPVDNKLTDFQIGTYCWAIHAIAAKSPDPAKRRDAAVRLVVAFRKAIDSPQFWGDERAADFGRTLFNSVVLSLYRVLKESNDDAGEAMLRKAGRSFLEILDMRARVFLDEAGFRKDPVTDVQRAAMERANGGRAIRMKAWPSIAEKAFGIANRCLKADSGLMMADGLVDFLKNNIRNGDWLGFYCANALIRGSRFGEARALLAEIARKKPGEFWVWTHLAEACADVPRDAVACLCRSLACMVRDEEIRKATQAKTHRKLARIFAATGESGAAGREAEYAKGATPSEEDMARYAKEADAANALVFGNKPPRAVCGGGREAGAMRPDASEVRFSGVLRKASGKEFGFVRGGAGTGDVFVPPRFAGRMKDGDRIAGVAALRKDKKKNRMSLCMISAL